MLKFNVGDKVLYLPDLQEAKKARDNLATVVVHDVFIEPKSVYQALACRTVVALNPFTVKCKVTGEVFDDNEHYYVLDTSVS